MKKILTVVSIICSAIAVHGATANWAASASMICDGTGSTSAKYSGAVYFFDAGLMTQEALYNALVGGADISTATGLAGSGTVSSTGSFNADSASFGYGTQGGSAISFYFAIVSGEQAYFSNILADQTPNGSDQAKSLSFSSQNATAKGTFSSVAPTGAGFNGSGYWSQIPEPTSGMLLMLGVGLMALKRKRA